MNAIRKPIAALLVLALPLILMVLLGSPAVADMSGQTNKCYIKYDKWTRDLRTTVATVDPNDSLVRWAKMRHSPRMVYRWCTRGFDPDTVQFLALAWCSRKLDGREVPYVWGTKFNAHTYNNAGSVRNPGESSMKWRMFAGDYWDQKCHYQDFKNSRVVLRGSHPYWKIKARVVIGPIMRDQTIPFIDRHYLGYSYDDNL